MKKLLLIAIMACSGAALAQKATVRLIEGKEYALAIDPKVKKQPDNKLDEFTLSQELVGNYFVAEYKGKQVFLEYDAIEKTEQFNKFFTKLTDRELKKVHKQWSNEFKDKNKDLIAKYGKVFGTAVALKNPRIGMTSEMVIDMFGKPNKSERTVTEYGKHDMYVYYDGDKSTYFWFDDHVLTSFNYETN